MKKHLFTTFIIATLLTGCAPKVVTDMLTNEWPATSPDSVYLFNTHDTLPAGSQTIGKVKVVDNGFSVKGTFDRVLQLAINATAEKGGNGLQITEHRWPDHRSTIHRVWGTMLRIPESAMIKQEEPENKISPREKPPLPGKRAWQRWGYLGSKLSEHPGRPAGAYRGKPLHRTTSS